MSLSDADFAARFRHLLRQPLIGMRTLTSGLSREPLSAPAKEILSAISQGLEETDIELQALGHFLWLSYGNPIPQPAPLELEDAMAAMIGRDSDLRGEGGRIETDLAPLTVCTDENLLALSILPLLDNALAFSKGSITLTARPQAGKRVAIVVKDEGIGISDHFMAPPYEPFRVENELQTSRPSRLGLGLPVSSRAIEALGGRLIFRRPETGGTEVTVDLPAHLPER
ncbi:putative two-component system sensor kinase [Parvularcula bermudensis HTCC2503]|uniref:histidine kinase n=1 Tax=Parvularcula bermudensis (strain ATCC BAA-594 / HTCC2503 / KCTC 12087) TaxID=314260 RepID=E0TFW7_PARBH|nr:sensor histidine kinase [Parvularcula bermudensis]ADM09566.1 putative two-component system sensor kinase [Parvularcula bermudensis HTCC2503]